MRKIYTLFALTLICSAKVFAQTGEIQGRVFDETTKEGLSFANVVLEQNGTQKGFAQADDDGNFDIKPVNPGTYDLNVAYLGYRNVTISGISVSSDQISFQPVPMSSDIKIIDPVIITAEPPLISPDVTTVQNVITHAEIDKMATRGTNNYIAQSANTFQRDDGDALNIGGGRSGATKFYVDGMPMRESVALPANSIEQIAVITGGIPARYGDATGGVINITTRGPSETYNGGFEGVSSQFLDGFGYNLGSFNLSGPILVRNRNTDSSNAIVGFFLSGEYEHDKDGDPSAIGMYKVKDDVLADLQTNPLQPSTLGIGFVPRADFITSDDLETIKYKQNVQTNAFRFAGKLNFELNKYMNLIVGSSFDLSHHYAYSYIAQLFDAEDGNQYLKDNTYRGFIRFTQRFANNNDKSKSASVFQDAYYSLQVDYTKFYQTFGDKELWFDPFKYGYVGKFETFRAPVYFYGQDTLTGLIGQRLLGYQDTLVKFTPGDVNPLMTNWTTQYYQLAGGDYQNYYSNFFDIQSGGGLLNSDAPTDVYSMWRNTGYPVGSYGIRNRDQLRLSMNASVDIVTQAKGEKTGKRRHALEFGFEYEQRVDAGYTVAPFGLWALARQLTNSHILQLDVAHPHPVYDATGTVFLDTINYDPLIQYDQQSYFDQSLRTALGVAPDFYIDVDSYDPSTFSLSMFSPDELLNNGSNYYFAFGYDYLGNRLKKQPSFDDFFNQFNDVNGNGVQDAGEYNTRNVAAFRPIYTAAYIQDKFNFRDLIFNIGLRVDRYDADQKVLKDPYSLYPIRTASEVTALNGSEITHPATIGNDYYVYVNDIENPTQIAGYRNGDTWYNSAGTEILDPSVIAKATTTGQISPYLEATDVSNLTLSSESFRDYTPQFTVMPRIAFSFPISDEALFFAHYDVLSERPAGNDVRGVSFGTPFDYYYLDGNNTGTLTNPNLKPEKTIDYQVGFKQGLGPNMALTISGTYRELKDNIQVRKYLFAYPVDYTTYGNDDFGTVKSIAVILETRRIRNIKMDADYTLQFASGTGSSATSGLNLLNTGNPLLRTLLPFDYDQRHTINIAVDYRFGEGKNYNGPTVGKSKAQMLANAGLNVIFRMGSGTPYTRQTPATPEGQFGIATTSSLDGSINGSRLPWTFKMDAKIDKDFKLKTNDKSGDGLYLNAYLLVQNVLDARNVVSVYHFTGNPGDDGYVASATGQQSLATQLDPETFATLYKIKINNPDNYTMPRRIHLGLIVNF